MRGQGLVYRSSLAEVIHQGEVELGRGIAAVRQTAVVVQNAAEVGLEITAVSVHQRVLLQRTRMALVGSCPEQCARFECRKRGWLRRFSIAQGRIFLGQQHTQRVLGAGVTGLCCGLVMGSGFPDIHWRPLTQRVQNTEVVVRLGATQLSGCAQAAERARNVTGKGMAVFADTAGHGIGRAVAG